MPQDAYTLRHLCVELNSLFSGAKVNRIVAPDNDELILTLYTGKKTERLLLSVNPGSPRIGVTDKDKEGMLTATNFCMLMRKHLLFSRIQNIELVGFDRIVKIDFLSAAEFSDQKILTVFVELMGRYSNIILTENGKVLGGNRGINMFDDGIRPLFVGKPYVFPPDNGKLLPKDQKIVEKLKQFSGEDFASFLASTIQGVALITAREIVEKFSNMYGQLRGNEQQAFEFIRDFLYSDNKNPCVIIDNDGGLDVFVYPYSNVSGNRKCFDKLYQAEEYYFLQKNSIKEFKVLKEKLSAVIKANIKKVKKKISAISTKQKDAEGLELNRIKGELLLSNIYRISKGETSCNLENYYDGTIIEVQLDKNLSVAENAEMYFKKYNKQKRTLSALKPQSEQAQAQLNYLAGLIDVVLVSKTSEELLHVSEEMENQGLLKRPKNARKKIEAEPFKHYNVSGFTVLVGRNNIENDRLLRLAHASDLWLHAKDYHSSHVIIRSGGNIVPEDVLLASAEICAYHSRLRLGGKSEIVFTERRNVKKPSGSAPGFVTYTEFKSITVHADVHEEFIKS